VKLEFGNFNKFQHLLELFISQGKKDFTVAYDDFCFSIHVIKISVDFPKGITPCRYSFTFSVLSGDSFAHAYHCFECPVNHLSEL